MESLAEPPTASPLRRTRVYGLDGCRGGWVAASADVNGFGEVTFIRVADADLCGFVAGVADATAAIAIDVPIGLAERGARACDRAARLRLGFPRQNSVFSAPCRGTLAAADYAEACSINRALSGRAISRETWNILKKIALVDGVLDNLPAVSARIWEAHPEVTFAELAASPRGIAARKKSADGRSERLALLGAYGVHLDVGRIQRGLRGGNATRDDIVDAAACLLTAARVARGEAAFFPSAETAFDGRGRRMRIAA